MIAGGLVDPGLGAEWLRAAGLEGECTTNCLHRIVGEVATKADQLLLVQTGMDDLTAEYAPAAQDALLEAGALDAVISVVSMGRAERHRSRCARHCGRSVSGRP